MRNRLAAIACYLLTFVGFPAAVVLAAVYHGAPL